MKVGWAPDSLQSIGENFVNTITAALWYLDPHHQRLASRGIHLPKEVGALQGYNDQHKKKMKKPRHSSSKVDGHIQSLSRTLTQPWLAKSDYRELRSLTEDIDTMHKYMEYLDQKNEQMKEAHKQTAPRRLGQWPNVIFIPAQDTILRHILVHILCSTKIFTG